MSERSHDKERPSLPQLNDLPAKIAAGEPSRGRDHRGRFAPGNKHAEERAVRAQVRRWLGKGATTAAVEQALREARVAFRAELRDLPCDAPVVQRLAGAAARDGVLSAHLALRAVEAGLETPEGRSMIELSMRLSARAERQTVTAVDLSQRMAAARAKADAPDWRALLTAPLPAQPPAEGVSGSGARVGASAVESPSGAECGPAIGMAREGSE